MDIKQIREYAMLTQEELAKIIGVTRLAVAKWEKGTNPSIKNRRKLAQFCKENGISVGKTPNQ